MLACRSELCLEDNQPAEDKSIRQCAPKTLDEWREYYLKNVRSREHIECDGDRYHGIDKWNDDMRRQRILERAGWRFWRCFASTFVNENRQDVIQDLMATLEGFGIEPIGSENNEALSIHTEQRKITAFNTTNENAI